MGIRSKTFVTILLVGIVVGIFILQINNKNLFQGKIFRENKNEDATIAKENNIAAPPDLTADLSVLPADENDDISVEVTIKNMGEGSITGSVPFEYAIYINEQMVFSNTDSYSSMVPGDEFSFTYPIPRAIYNYPDTGKVKIILDTKNTIKESNEKNNEIEASY